MKGCVVDMAEFSIRFDFERPDRATEAELEVIRNRTISVVENAVGVLSEQGVYLRRATSWMAASLGVEGDSDG